MSSSGVCPGSLCLFLQSDVTTQLLMMLSSEDNFQSLLQSRRMDMAHSRGALSWPMSSAMSHLAGPTFNPFYLVFLSVPRVLGLMTDVNCASKEWGCCFLILWSEDRNPDLDAWGWGGENFALFCQNTCHKWLKGRKCFSRVMFSEVFVPVMGMGKGIA